MILETRKSQLERNECRNYLLQRHIQNYIKNGSYGNLNFFTKPLKHIPNNLTCVKGSLNLDSTLIKILPNNLTIYGYLSIDSTKITKLPNNLTVYGNLYIINTYIEILPKNLYLDGHLYYYNTPLSERYNESEIKKMCTIKGVIHGNL